MLTLNISHKKINVITDHTLACLIKLSVLDLSFNQLNYISSCMLNGLVALIPLQISGNNLPEIEADALQHLFTIKEIITENYRLCCIKPYKTVKCTAFMEWPASCDDLISNQLLRIGMWITFMVILITSGLCSLHTLLGGTEQRGKLNCFQLIYVTGCGHLCQPTGYRIRVNSVFCQKGQFFPSLYSWCGAFDTNTFIITYN